MLEVGKVAEEVKIPSMVQAQEEGKMEEESKIPSLVGASQPLSPSQVVGGIE